MPAPPLRVLGYRRGWPAAEASRSMNKRLAALDFITGCLRVSRGPALDEPTRAIVDAGSLDWKSVIAIAQSEFVTPALWVGMQRRGFAASAPAGIREYLWKIHLLATLRNKQLKEQAIALTRELNAIGVEPTILKGGASLFLPTYDDPGCRLMADLDLLVPSERAQECWETVMRRGYVPNPIDFDYSAHHHLRPLRRESGIGTIEIHRSLLAVAPGNVVSDEFIAKHLQMVIDSGVRLNIPDATLRILHILLHSGVVDRHYVRGSMCLRALHEIALIQSSDALNIDWESISEIMERAGKRQLLGTWLYCAHRMFGSPLTTCGSSTFQSAMQFRRMRLQASTPLLARLVEEGMSFSRQDICFRYKCPDDFLSLTAGRLRLAASLGWQHAGEGSSRALRWATHRSSDRSNA